MNPRLRWTVWICLAIVLATSLTGCTGCNQDPLVKRKKALDDIDKKKKKEKRKEDFDLKPVKTVPADEVAVRPFAKPGHWLTTIHEIKANNFNFPAQLHTGATDSRGQPYHVESTQYVLQGSRPAKLAKGQGRLFETTYFVPREGAMPSKVIWLNRELRAARGGRLVTPPDRSPITAMPGYQYYFVVLSSTPSRYGFLQRLTAMNTPTSKEFEDETLLYYRVLQPQVDRFVPLPSNALTWTCISYLLLDDLDQSRFTPPQERALLDWLHWGGQVIISGPNSLDKLKGSFLEDYLPAQSGDTIEIDPAAIEELNKHWSLPSHPRSGRTRRLEVLPQTPMIGVALHQHPDAVPLANTANLVLERRIGQGRIVVSSFSLTDRYFMQWGASYDSFFNACLLRRPRREFIGNNTGLELLNTVWKDFPGVLAKDPRLVTTQRYFTRDIGHALARNSAAVEPGEEKNLHALEASDTAAVSDPRTADNSVAMRSSNSAEGNWHFDGYPSRLNYGLGAWNDRSGASDAARQSLEDAAGISIPQSGFVLRVLALYLLILAPVNWGLFRMIGRVEWAWMAAPVIAIVGAFVVARTAQLDIGFARSVTEVVVAEVHGDYPRAHVTRYSALYTSLSTGYDFVFDDNSAVAQPFGSIDFRPDTGESVHTVTMHREGNLRFGGIQVISNSIGYMHCEQHADLGGVFSLTGNDTQGFQINNGSKFSLKGAGILRGGQPRRVAGARVDGPVQAAWVGDLKAGSFAPLTFVDLPSGTNQLPQWDDALATLSYNRQAKALLERLDANHNKVIDRREAAGDPELSDKFNLVDIDGVPDQPPDGRLVDAEIKHWCRKTRAGEVSIGQLVELASQGLTLDEGEVRLIAYSDDEIPGMTIRPSAAQVMRRTLFVVHLRRAPMSPAVRDVNCKADLTDEKERKLDEKDLEDPDQDDAVQGNAAQGNAGTEQDADGKGDEKPTDDGADDSKPSDSKPSDSKPSDN